MSAPGDVTTADPARHDNRLVIALTGDLDTRTDAPLQHLISDRVDGVPVDVVLDLAEVDFMDCGGIRAVIRAHHLAQASGGTLVVINVKPHIAWLFQITGVGALITPPG